MTFPSVGYFALTPSAARLSEPAVNAQGPEPCVPNLGLGGRAFGVSYDE